MTEKSQETWVFGEHSDLEYSFRGTNEHRVPRAMSAIINSKIQPIKRRPASSAITSTSRRPSSSTAEDSNYKHAKLDSPNKCAILEDKHEYYVCGKRSHFELKNPTYGQSIAVINHESFLWPFRHLSTFCARTI
jgi:hypothetical protein